MLERARRHLAGLALGRFNLTFLFIVAAAAIPAALVVVAGLYPQHDSLLAFEHFAYTYSTLRQWLEIPSWNPYVGYGQTTTLFDLTYLGPPQYSAMAIGALLGLHDLDAFCLSLWASQTMYLAGLFLLARELRIPHRHGLLLVLAASLLTQLLIQPDYSYGISWPLWWACWMILRLFRTADFVYLAGLFAFGGTFFVFGHLTYCLVVQFYFLLLWFLCCLGGTALGPISRDLRDSRAAGAERSPGGSGPLRRSSLLSKYAVLSVAVLLGAVGFALFAHKILDLRDNYVVTAAGRDLTSGVVPLNVFLFYAGNGGLEKIASIAAGTSPSPDFSLFAGKLTLAFACGGVALTLWRKDADPLQKWFVVSAMSLVLLVLTFITPDWFEVAVWAYRLPGMPLVRHISQFGQIAIPLILLLAGVGIQRYAQTGLVGRTLIIAPAIALALLLPDQTSISAEILCALAVVAGARKGSLLWLVVIAEVCAHSYLYGEWNLLPPKSSLASAVQSPASPRTVPLRIDAGTSTALRDFVEATTSLSLMMQRYAIEGAYLKEDYCLPPGRLDSWLTPVYLLNRALLISASDSPPKRHLYGCGTAKIEQLKPDLVASSLAQAITAMHAAALRRDFAPGVIDAAGAMTRQPMTGRIARVTVASFTPDRIRMQIETVDGAALVAMYDAMHPWWRATQDGEPTALLPANIAFKSVIVPSGVHEVVFSISDLQRVCRWLEFGLLCLAQALALSLAARAIRAVAPDDPDGALTHEDAAA